MSSEDRVTDVTEEKAAVEDSVKDATVGVAEAARKKAEDLKTEGNVKFMAGDMEGAIELYTASIEADPTYGTVYGNRSAAYLKAGKLEKAIGDGLLATKTSPKWTKGWLRYGQALEAHDRMFEAIAAYETAVMTAPKDAYARKMLNAAHKTMQKRNVENPVKDSDHWLLIFNSLRDIRLRLATMATFWNASSKEEKHNIFRRFLQVVTGSEATHEAMDKLDVASMMDLPMDNYVDIEVPRMWEGWYPTLSSKDKVDVFHRMWELATDAERGLIMKDTEFLISGKESSDSEGDDEDPEDAAGPREAADASGGGGGGSGGAAGTTD